jgi:ketosteroid isomerase-like protein
MLVVPLRTDAVVETQDKLITGVHNKARQRREEIRDLFQGWQPKNHLSTVDPDSPHLIGTAGDTFWVTGGWSETGQGQGGEAVPLQGYWSAIYTREGEDWKLRMLAVNVTPHRPRRRPRWPPRAAHSILIHRVTRGSGSRRA